MTPRLSRRTFTSMLAGVVPATGMRVPMDASARYEVLDHVTRRLRRMDSPLRPLGLARIAGRWREAGKASRAAHLLDEAARAFDAHPRAIQVAVLAERAALEADERGARRAVDLAAATAHGDERRMLFGEILRAMRFVPSTGARAAEAILDAVERENPCRAAVLLARLAEPLSNFEGGARVAELASGLVEEERVRRDPLYLSLALKAGATCADAAPFVLLPALEGPIRMHFASAEEPLPVLAQSLVRLGRWEWLGDVLARPPARFADIVHVAAVADLLPEAVTPAARAELRDAAWRLESIDERRRALVHVVPLAGDEPDSLAKERLLDDVARARASGQSYLLSEVLRVSAEASFAFPEDERLDIVTHVRHAVDHGLRTFRAGDISFLFDPLRVAVDASAEIGSPRAESEIRAAIDLAERSADEQERRIWTPFYRQRTLVACARALVSLGHESDGLRLLESVLDTDWLRNTDTAVLDRSDILTEASVTLSWLELRPRARLFDRLIARLGTDRYGEPALTFLIEVV